MPSHSASLPMYLLSCPVNILKLCYTCYTSLRYGILPTAHDIVVHQGSTAPHPLAPSLTATGYLK